MLGRLWHSAVAHAPKLPLTTCHARQFRHPIPSVHPFEWGPLFDGFRPVKVVAVAPEWRGVPILMQAEVRSSAFCKYLGIMTETKMIAMHTS
jgi:hypothetical protein